jgi:ribosomal protein S18 acetylase RimI-like enzyme
MVRRTNRGDKGAILGLVKESGQFDDAGLAHVEQTLESYFNGEDEALWLTADDGEPVGVAYCAPEPVTRGTWNLLMLWTRKDREGRGHGFALVNHVERALVNASARLLIVETSGLAEFEKARNFYRKSGFIQEARIKNFFAEGDDKLVYTKAISQG